MGFIKDNDIHILYTQKYRDKKRQGKTVVPKYFSLLDAENNYNLINNNDQILNNDGFERNDVTSDLDIELLSIPILEPHEDIYSTIYGKWIDNDYIADLDSAGDEAIDDIESFVNVKSYFFRTQYVNEISEEIICDTYKYGLNYNFYDFKINNSLHFYDDDIYTDVSSLLDQYNDNKTLTNEKFLEASGNYDPTSLGFFTLYNQSDYSSHKIKVLISSDNFDITKEYDITDVSMKTSKSWMFNPYEILSDFSYPFINFGIEIPFNIHIVSYIKVYLQNNTYGLLTASSPKVKVRVLI